MHKKDVLYIYIYVYTYNRILLSHKKNAIMPHETTWMDIEFILLSELSQKEKEKYHITYTCNLSLEEKL